MSSYNNDHGPFSASPKGKEPAIATWSAPPQSIAFPKKTSSQRPPLSQLTFVKPQPSLHQSRSAGGIPAIEGNRRGANRSSTTWTTSSGDLILLSGSDDVEDRGSFVLEYNRLAKRYGIRLLVPGDFPSTAANTSSSLPSRKGSWFSKVLRQTSSGQPTRNTAAKPDQRQLSRRRSISDLALNLVHHQRKDGLKDEDLPALVRLCGKSLFYLPSEYAPCALVLPTCFRALAQALVQQADARGIFRVPGSVRVVNALYEYYCADRDASDISSTTRCPTLPTHIKCGVHDLASTFKKFLAGLPGGILGSLAVFDALVAIHSQFHGDPELNRTKETRLRARLIALAIGTVRSQYQRELICAVFGLLCLVGRAAEIAPREDEEGRPLPTGDLMGYNALGIIFGPLLVGDLINSYSMKLADPSVGLVLLPLSPPKSRKEKHGKSKRHAHSTPAPTPTPLAVDKIHVANSITEMLIVHWREVVRHMRSVGSLKTKRVSRAAGQRANRNGLASSVSDSFPLRKPPDWDNIRPVTRGKERGVSPMTISPTPTPRNSHNRPAVTPVLAPSSEAKTLGAERGLEEQTGPLVVERRRSRPSSSSSSHKMPTRASTQMLSPTVEESPSKSPDGHGQRQVPQGTCATPLSYVPDKEDRLDTVQSYRRASLQNLTDPLGPPAQGEDKAVMRQKKSISQISSPPSIPDKAVWMRSATQGQDESSLSDVDTKAQQNDQGFSASKSTGINKVDTSVGPENTGGQSIQSQDSSGGSTPLGDDGNNALTRPITTAQLSQSENEDDEIPEEPISSSTEPSRLYLHQNIALLHGESPFEPVLSDTASTPATSHLTELPSLQKSVSKIENNDLNSLLIDDAYPRTMSGAENSDLLLTPTANVVMPQTRVLSEEKGSYDLDDKSFSGKQSIAKRSPFPGIENPPQRFDDDYFHISPQKASPVEKWKALAQANRASTESPAKSAKEKRLVRGSPYGSRQSEESLATGERKPTTPEWKRQLMDKKSEAKRRPASLSPEKKSMFEKSPQSISSRAYFSPIKGRGWSPAKSAVEGGSRPVSQRSSSRPVGGAVKAMAALFDTGIKDSPTGEDAAVIERHRHNLKESNSVLSQYIKSDSSARSVKSTITTVARTPSKSSESIRGGGQNGRNLTIGEAVESPVSRSNFQEVHSRPVVEENPTKFPRIALRPTGTSFTAARKTPRSSPVKSVDGQDQALDGPPVLGTMVPHREEPPVAHHLNLVRPPSATSLQAQNTNCEYLDLVRGNPLLLSSESPRHPNGNSILYAQIRHLQRHLEDKSNEVIHLRHQLETHENMDIGTLSEQLREAKRECRMWRERAEAAEKRIAVFEGFTTRFRELREAMKVDIKQSQENEARINGPSRGNKPGVPDSSSFCSEHTEVQEVLKDRIRSTITQGPHGRGGDGTGLEEDGDVFGNPALATPGTWGSISNRTADLWVAAEELLNLQEELQSWDEY